MEKINLPLIIGTVFPLMKLNNPSVQILNTD
jgi:hypothetical protein